MTTTTIPNLAGVIKTTDIYKKMKFDYVPWAKTAQLLREHAPGWQFFLKPSNPNGDIFSYIHIAPDNTGFLMGYFEHIETGKSKHLLMFLQLQIMQIDLFNLKEFFVIIFKIHIVDVFVPVLVKILVLLMNYGLKLKSMKQNRLYPNLRKVLQGLLQSLNKNLILLNL